MEGCEGSSGERPELLQNVTRASFFYLQKLVNKTYEKMVPSAADAENIDGGSGDKGKSKAPSMYRIIKSRLQKLVDKADDSYA